MGDVGDPSSDSSEEGSFDTGPDDTLDMQTECDPWLQDCPEDEKCVPYSTFGGTWDENKCVPILGEGQLGDVCSYAGTVDATDDCDGDHLCWHANNDEGEGVCLAFCTGTLDAPECEAGYACFIANKDAITICRQTCDPLDSDCAGDMGCYWHAFTPAFICGPTSQNLPTGSPCAHINDCAPGNVCTDVVESCVEDDCCVAFCAVDDPDACPDPDLVCVPFFSNDPELPDFEHLGVCATGP